MTRYIEANVLLHDLTIQKAAFETVHGGRSGLFAKGFACGLDGAIQCVKNALGEDVSPVKHGKWERWIYNEDQTNSLWRCTSCGIVVADRKCLLWKYCPNCGARMGADHD